MKAFHDNPKIKSNYIARVRAHREADQLVQGFGYWQYGKGCAAAAADAAADAARKQARIVQSEKLLELLAAAPTTEPK